MKKKMRKVLSYAAFVVIILAIAALGFIFAPILLKRDLLLIEAHAVTGKYFFTDFLKNIDIAVTHGFNAAFPYVWAAFVIGYGIKAIVKTAR